MGLAGLVQDVNLSPKCKKPLKAFKQKGDNFMCCSERPLSPQDKGGKCEKTTEEWVIKLEGKLNLSLSWGLFLFKLEH